MKKLMILSIAMVFSSSFLHAVNTRLQELKDELACTRAWADRLYSREKDDLNRRIIEIVSREQAAQNKYERHEIEQTRIYLQDKLRMLWEDDDYRCAAETLFNK